MNDEWHKAQQKKINAMARTFGVIERELCGPLWSAANVADPTADDKIANADASKVDLDPVVGQLPALKKIEHDLAYRMPGSGRPLSHSVISRRQAEEVVAKLAQANTFDSYQEMATGTAIYPGRGAGLQGVSYCTIKLAGEVGEICEKVGKLLRDADGVMTVERRDALILEMGDVCWYLAALATELNVPLAEVFQRNVVKIISRKARGVIGGDGDNR
jgi:NTP pyrophosphatase (non-canonical NTP hydrolase)